MRKISCHAERSETSRTHPCGDVHEILRFTQDYINLEQFPQINFVLLYINKYASGNPKNLV